MEPHISSVLRHTLHAQHTQNKVCVTRKSAEGDAGWRRGRVKRGPGWCVGCICVASWPNKQINVLSTPVSVSASGSQFTLLKPREEDHGQTA